MKSRTVSLVVMIIFSLLLLGAGVFMFTRAAANDVPVEPPVGFVLVDAQVKAFSESTCALVQFEYEGKTIERSVDDVFFKKIGDNIEVFYNPQTGEVKSNLMLFESLITKVIYLPAIMVLLMGLFFAIPTILVIYSVLTFYRKENIVTGVITNMTEVQRAEDVFSPEALKVMSMIRTRSRNRRRALVREAHQRFIITCTFTSPETGEIVTAMGTNEKPTTLTVGDSVTVVYNKKNPEASVVDVDGTVK